jgi:apolipoprotein N-acyltransferase
MRRFFLVVLIGITFTAAARTTTSPTRNYRLVQPWSKLKSLSDTQRRQIYEIHQLALEEIKKVQQKEKAEILALLSDQQKLELVESEEEKAVAQKLRAAANREATTQPATAPAQ